MDKSGQDPATKVGAAPLRDVMNLLAGTFYILSEAGHFILWNKKVEQVTGLSPSQLGKIHMLELVMPADRPKVTQASCAVFQQPEPIETEANLLLSNRSVPYMLWSSRLQIGTEKYLCGMGLDLSRHYQQKSALELRERALHAAANGIVITRCDGSNNPIEYVNPAFEHITGYSAREVLGRDSRFMAAPGLDQAQRTKLHDAILARRAAQIVFRNQRKNGEQFWNQLTVTPVQDDKKQVTHFIGIIEDITALKQRTAELEHQVTHDPLTGVANRTLLRDRLEHAIHAAHRGGQQVAVVLMDLNKFKEINDTLGHEAGDQVLRLVASRLKSAVRDTDTVARLGGDEFVIILAEQPNLRFTLRMLERIRQAMANDVFVEGRDISVGASMGVAIYPQDGDSFNSLLKAADAAMYAGKGGGPDSVHFYSAEIANTSEARRRTEVALREALARDDIFLMYQPHVCVKTGKLNGLEALLRWRHPERGELLPGEFLRDAEENGLIIPIGRRVLEKVCNTLIRLGELGYPDVPISINASSREFSQRDYLPFLAETMAQHGIHPRRLELELRESQLMRDPEQARRLADGLQELGVGLSLDEFGGGLSNLSCLETLPVDYLKMTSKPMRDIGAHGLNGALVKTMLDIGNNLNIQVIATGVETQSQRDFLAAHGCKSMQGKFVSAPLSRTALEQWLGSSQHAINQPDHANN